MQPVKTRMSCRDCPAHIHGGKDDDDAPEIPTAAEKNIYRSRLDLRGSDRASNIPRRLDLLCGHLRLFVGLWLGLDSCPHPRIAGRRGDDLSVAVGSGSASICDLQRFCHSSGIADLHCLIRWRHRNRNGLVVACSSGQQALKRTAARVLHDDNNQTEQVCRRSARSHASPSGRRVF
jgi:hypothetical protein